MEPHWSHASPGKHGAAGEGFSIRDSQRSTQILEQNPEDDFECTYFRQRITRSPIKRKKSGELSPMTIRYTLPPELSDGYTDSESESDNTSNVERWLESLPTNDAWSSSPNYSALNGSEGIEGVDEIQEDIEKSLENEFGACLSDTDDSRKIVVSETGDSKIKVTGAGFAKRMSARQDEIPVLEERINRRAPRRTIKRTPKTRQKVPLWPKMEQEAKTLMENEKLSEEKANDKPYYLSEKNISTKTEAAWSKGNILETTESRTAIEKPYIEENGYDKVMQEMVNRLLTVSGYREDRLTSEKAVKAEQKIEQFKDSKELFDGKKSEETVDSSLARVGMKRTSLSNTFKKFNPKLTKTKTSEDQLSKRKKKAVKKKTLTQNPEKVMKISQGKKPSVTKHLLVPVHKTRNVISSPPFSDDQNSRKKKSQSRTVRFQDEVFTRTSFDSWRETAMVKATRNKQILKAIEQIVDEIQLEGLCYGSEDICARSKKVEKVSEDSVCELEFGDTGDFEKSKTWWKNRKRPMQSIENKTIGNKKPMFANPFVENCLDRAMDFALSKYKCHKNTWEDFNEEKLRENLSSIAYEPPAKKRKSKSFPCKLENTQCQDFSVFDSWQSIHNYFLSYSSCK